MDKEMELPTSDSEMELEKEDDGAKHEEEERDIFEEMERERTNERSAKREREDDEGEWTKVEKPKKYKPESKLEKIELFISSKEKLPKQFAIAKLFTSVGLINITSIKYLNQYKLKLEVPNDNYAAKVIDCEEFRKNGWRVQRASEVTMSYGVIRGVDLELTDNEILKDISCPSQIEIVSAKRLQRRDKENKWVPSEVARLVFAGPQLPAYVNIDNLRIKVEPFVFPATQCSSCWRFGHTKARCSLRNIICPKCGGLHENCEVKTFKCVNCQGDHMALNRSCPVFIREKRLRELMAEYNCTYRVACSMYVQPEPHYGDTRSNENKISQDTFQINMHNSFADLIPDDTNNHKYVSPMPTFAQLFTPKRPKSPSACYITDSTRNASTSSAKEQHARPAGRAPDPPTDKSDTDQVIKSSLDFIKTQLCTLAISLTLFNSARLPREAFRYGTLPYLVVYSAWLVLAALPASLLQLAVGQLSQQDPVGVWRAVPILRGVGHLKVITSYICSVYTMMYVGLSAAYLIWIGKGSFPLKDCTKLQITPRGYENKMNASECFNSTFLAPFTMYPQYLGIMAIIIFILWFFVPILLYRLRKSLKVSLSILGPITLIAAIVLCTFLSNADVLFAMLEDCEQWNALSEPYIWHSAMVQALLSTQVAGGYLISAGGTIYRYSDVRWTSIMIIIVNLLAGWLWVFLWESIGGEGLRDTSFVSILVVIYQSSVTDKRSKEWPLLAYGIVVASGIITVLFLLFPIFCKMCRMFNDHWRLTATASSAVGTTLTIAVLLKGVKVATVLDELVVPVLAAFTTAVEIVGFVFIYGWYYLTFDLEFLTGTKLPWIWIVAWTVAPILLIGVSGWWLRVLLKATWNQTMTLWPLGGVLVGILVVLVIMAAIAVAKEEQFNLISKIASSFRSSRLWGPEEPMARYVWMSQRITTEHNSESNFPQVTQKTNQIYAEDWLKPIDSYEKSLKLQNGHLPKDDTVYQDKEVIYTKQSILRNKVINKGEEKFRSPNICVAKTELGGPLACNCNRHFTLNVPDLRKSEITTSL